MKKFSENDIPNIAGELIGKARQAKLAAPKRATLVTFSGNLGAGKTTMIKEIAKQLGVQNDLQSPTYVIYKKYPLGLAEPRPLPLEGGDTSIGYPWKFLIHGDMYRLEHADEILNLDWENLLQNPENLILIEWPEMIGDAIPDHAIRVSLTHVDESLRGIDF
jgi:tRNA threonylcarbamoyladenosine biosynthesis protein TsaE